MFLIGKQVGIYEYVVKSFVAEQRDFIINIYISAILSV